MLYGLDLSSWQADLDLARVADEGFDFVFCKATEGDEFTDPTFPKNLAAARAAELLVAAYHYQRGEPSAHEQALNIVRTVPPTVPVLLDIEDGSGDLDTTRGLIDALADLGWRVPLIYLPRWYWSRLGQPDLATLPPLWASHYPDNDGGDAAEIYPRVPDEAWNAYGGNTIEILQFTSIATIAGQQPVDANAYPGTRAQLTTLLNTGSPGDP